MTRLKRALDKTGMTGSVLAAAACPICFPKLAAIGAIFGLGVLAPFETYFFSAVQAFVLLAVTGQVIAFRRLRNPALLGLAVVSTTLFFISLYGVVSENLSYVALAGIVLSGIWLMKENRTMVPCQTETAAREIR